LEDNLLAAMAGNGDRDAFAVLFERYRRHVYSVAFKVVLDPDDALDVAQSVFLKLATKIGQFNGSGTFRGWLSTMTAREAIDHLRKIGRVGNGDAGTPADTEPEGLPQTNRDNPAQAFEKSEEIELVSRAMHGLSLQQRAILVLRLREDLGPKEIAQRLDIPEKQVRSQTYRGIAKIRETLRRS